MANTTLNTSPIYTASGDTQWTVSATTANTTKDLTGAGTAYTAFTASSTGGYVQRIRFMPLGTNIATVARIWINNGGTTTTAANNTLWDNISLAATQNSEASGQPVFELPLNIALPPNYRIIVTLGSGVAAGYTITVIGGKY